MLTCPVCNSQNDELALLCRSCGGFLQARVPTLDLFSTIWQLIEAPRKAMRRIALSMHKNYAVLLSCLYGISLAFFFMWRFNLGEEFENILYLIFAGLLFGPPLGLIHIGLVGFLGSTAGRISGVSIRFIDIFGTASYATVPLILALVFILPIEILTFGLYMFSNNPSPFVIKPVSYVVFLILDGVAGVWSFALFVVGVRTIGSLPVWKSIVFATLTVGLPFLLVSQLIRLSL